MAALTADSVANLLIQRAIAADARLETPDSVYAPDAEVIADGERRSGPPRFAGVGLHGRLVVGNSRTAVTGGFVWGSIDYRWMPGLPTDPVVPGRATIIIGKLRDGSWRILHLHSSTARDTTRPASPQLREPAGRTGEEPRSARGG